MAVIAEEESVILPMLSTAMLPDEVASRAGQSTGMGSSLREILERVDRRLAALDGLSANAASARAKKTDAIRNLRRAVKEGREGISTATITALAPVLETTVSWLMEGVGDEDAHPNRPPHRNTVRVVGYAGAGAETHFFVLPEEDLDEVDAPIGATSRTKAIEIRGQCLGALFDRWYAFFDDVRSPVTDDLVGHLCVVGLEDGRVLIKKLRRARRPGLYRLLSEQDPPIEDVAIAWAARVKSMSPG